MSTVTADILDRAADIIERNGLHKGSFCDDGPGAKAKIPQGWACCSYGAINIAANGERPWQASDGGEAAYRALVKHLGISDGHNDTVADWSDHPDRTVAEVIAALRGAAQVERERAA
jgi:hypothetical protein